ncbi:MAG: hypothetical protein ACFFFB_15270, partial [Candidatus Heimdallarchaeota archaeon]
KMKKRTKLILIAALGIYFISFMPAVLGKANSRPIEDFTATNDYVAAWLDPETNLIIFPHGFFITPPDTEVIADCEHHGSVLERDLKDGRILYRINLHVKGAWILVGDYGVNPMIFEGEMDYSLTAVVIVEGVLGGPVPSLFDVWFLGAGEAPYSHITGSGTGTFLVDAMGFSAGETANVKVNQVGLTKPEGHPFYPGMWPVELVFFH